MTQIPLTFHTSRTSARRGWAAFWLAHDGFLADQQKRRGVGHAFGTYRTPAAEAPVDIFLLPEDLRHHAVLLGGTGSGKSSLLETLARLHLGTRQGFALLDLHGDLFTRVAAWVLHANVRRPVVYLDFTQPDCLPGWNPLTPWPDVDAGRQVDCLVGVLKRLYADERLASWSWGIKVHEVISWTLRACLESTLPATLVDLRQFLLLPALRRRLLATVRPETRAYFGRFGPREQQYVSAVLNKLDPFLGSLAVQRFLGVPTSTFDLMRVIDDGTLLLVNLAKGHLGPTADILGRLLVNVLELAALRRGRQPPETRTPYSILLDEAHNLADMDSGLEDLLVAARKYRVYVTLAAQSLSLFPPRFRPHLLGNTERQYFFRLPFSEAKTLAPDLFEPLGSVFRAAIRPTDRLDDPLLTPVEELKAFTQDLAHLPTGACLWSLRTKRYKARRIQLTKPDALPFTPAVLADRLRAAMLARLHPPDPRAPSDLPF